MRFLFVSAQLPGHLDWGGYLATAVALLECGHEVVWASGQQVASLVQGVGLAFHPLAETGWRWPPPPPPPAPPDLDETQFRRLRAERALDQWLDVERVAQACTELLDLGQRFRPDVVVSEVFVGAAGLAAEGLATPFVVAGWPAMPPKIASGDEPLVAEARQRLNHLLARFGLHGFHWTADGAPALLSARLHITYWSPRWYNGLTLLPQTRHVGGVRPPRAMPRPPTWPEQDPWVLITLGTSFNLDLNFFLAAAHAAVAVGCLPILAIGDGFSAVQLTELGARLPRQAITVARVDFGAVLPNVAAAIHHGGAGTTHALVEHATPQIVVPHAAEQMHQAQGVVRSGVGLYVPAKEATIARLTAALAQVLPDLSPIRVAAQTLQAEFAQLGGAPQAAQLLENTIRSHR